MAFAQSEQPVPDQNKAVTTNPPQETPQEAGKDSKTAGIQDIVVTANRRSQNLQRVPLTVVAFQAVKLTSLGIKSTIDLPQLVPGFVLSRQLASANSYLRGVGTANSGFTSETPVAVYIDGLYLPNSAGAIFSFNNIERIEVLKGPQGTLYGRNTTGGLIHVITKDPDPTKSSVDASVGYANYNMLTANFYGSTPITDNLSANIAATYTNQKDGWGRNVFTGKDNMKQRDIGFQAKVQWRPGPDTKITFRGFYDHLNSDQGVVFGIYPGSVGVDGTRFLGKYRNTSRATDNLRQTQYNLSVKGEQDLGFANFTSTTGYIHIAANFTNTQNGVLGNPVAGQSAVYLNGPLFKAQTFSQEIQLSSKPSATDFQWTTGLFYYHDNTVVRTDVFGTCLGTVCAATPVPTRTTGRPHTRSYSAYAEGTYNFTPATHLTLGLRYTRDHKMLSGFAEPVTGLPNSPAALPSTAILHPGDPYASNPNGIDTDVTFAKLTYRAVLAQDLSDDIHAYLSYNRGFKAGGFNPLNFGNPSSRPEVLDSFEGGIKSFLFDRVLRLNVAGFYYNYKDIQLRLSAPPAPPGGTILYNAANAHIKGVDADFELRPTASLAFNGGFEYLDAKYNRFPTGTCSTPRVITGTTLGGASTAPCDLTGNHLPLAPKFSLNMGATYTYESGIGKFVANINDLYKTKVYWDPDNRIAEKGYHLLSASLTWSDPSDKFSVQLFGRNLTGTYYFINVQQAQGGNDDAIAGAPRTYGVNLRYHF